MPREIVLITPAPVTRGDWAEAAAAVGRAADLSCPWLGSARGGPFVAKEEPGAVTISAPGSGTVLTAMRSARAEVTDEVARLVPEAADLVDQVVWWTEAWAPWGAAGAAGVAMSQALASSLGGVAQTAVDA
jgi:hypothetical protein